MFRSRRYRSERERRQQEEAGEPPVGETPVGEPPRIAATSFILLGLILGLVGGLLYTWVINPVVYVDASPERLSNRYKDEYVFLVSQNYAATGDWERAQERLQALEDTNLSQRVAALFEQYLREGRPAGHVRNLAILTQQLGGESPALSLFGPTPMPPPVTPEPTAAANTPTATLLPTPTLTRRPTNTPRPTLTPTPTQIPTITPRPVYRLLNQERLCDADEPAPRIEVLVVDALLEPLAGAEVLVTWEGGSDRFFTGFQPDQDPGFGDFVMEPDVSYSVTMAEGSPTISGLRVEACPAASGGLPGGWRLTFQNLTVNEPTATPEE